MKRRIRMSRSARRDVNAAWHWIAESNRVSANRMLDRLQELYRLLIDHPEVGRPRPDLNGAVRSIPADPYVIYYSADLNGIRIHRVLHGARDVRPQDLAVDDW